MKKCLKYFYLFIDQKSIKAFNTEVISKQEFLNSKLRFFFWKKKNQNVDTTKKLLKGTHTIAFFSFSFFIKKKKKIVSVRKSNITKFESQKFSTT